MCELQQSDTDRTGPLERSVTLTVLCDVFLKIDCKFLKIISIYYIIAKLNALYVIEGVEHDFCISRPLRLIEILPYMVVM